HNDSRPTSAEPERRPFISAASRRADREDQSRTARLTSHPTCRQPSRLRLLRDDLHGDVTEQARR
ncbi:MAG: hypothetical protein PVI01_18515, partial [Gemmatimonadales bacterium]